MEACDEDNDGGINVGELHRCIDRATPPSNSTGFNTTHLKARFDMLFNPIDTSQDCEISQHELKHFVHLTRSEKRALMPASMSAVNYTCRDNYPNASMTATQATILTSGGDGTSSDDATNSGGDGTSSDDATNATTPGGGSSGMAVGITIGVLAVLAIVGVVVWKKRQNSED